MDDFYSVSTVNRFSMFSAVEDDPGDSPFSPTNASAPETINDVKKDKSGKARTKDKQQTTKTAPKQVENVTKKVEEGSKQNRQGKTGERTSSTSGFSSNRGKPQKRFQDRGKQNAEEQEEGEGRQTTTGRGRGVRRGGRGGMGRTGMAGRGGKREFDRRSGSDKTSVKPVEKREGGGAHNWGNVRDDLKASTSDQNEWQTEETGEVKDGETVKEETEQKQESEEKPETQEVNGENGDVQQEDESAKEMTLDEYKAMKEKTRAKTDFKERKAGEDEDNAQWKNTVPLKKDESCLFAGTREVIEKPKTSGRKVEVLQPNFYFKDPTRNQRGGSRGGRGGGGAGRGRDRDKDRGPERERGGDRERERFSDRERPSGDRDRGNRSKGSRRERLPDVDNEKEFPSLGPTN